jgi:hypothetical protein
MDPIAIKLAAEATDPGEGGSGEGPSSGEGSSGSGSNSPDTVCSPCSSSALHCIRCLYNALSDGPRIKKSIAKQSQGGGYQKMASMHVPQEALRAGRGV